MFSFRREKHKEFKHIAHGLIPAASLAPKPAVPRTPPPRSPAPSPERPRSALAAAILSSSLTGQTWAIPPVWPRRSFSEGNRSDSFITEPNLSTALYTKDKWSEDLSGRPRLSSPDQSEEEFEEEEVEEEVEEVENEADGEEHVYQSLDRQEDSSVPEPVYALPLKPKISTPEPTLKSRRRVPSPDFTEESSVQSSEAGGDSSNKKASIKKSLGSWKEVVPSRSAPSIITIHPSQPIKTEKNKNPTRQSPEPIKAQSSEAQREAVLALSKKNTRMLDEQKHLEERLQRLEQEISHSQASSNLRPSAGNQAELQNLRRHAQELVDENDALKLTVHRLNVELSRYQTRFRPLSKQESSRMSGLPKTGSPPPWLLDMKYISPLLLAYEDRMNEQDALLQTTEKEVKRLHVRAEEVIKENERLHEEIAKMGGVSQKDCQQLQQQAFLVLQENQVLIDQLEAQHVKAKTSHGRHHSEVSKVSKQLMLLEAEKQRLQEDLEETRRELQKNMREVQVLQARLKDAVTWEEHCNIAGKLRRQLEEQEHRNKSEMEEFLLKWSSLQEENRSLALDKANLTADIKRMEAEMALTKQANRKAERKMSVLKRQKEECVLTEEKTRQYMGAVISVAEHLSQERDQLLQMASLLNQEKQGFINRMLNGTVRFGKLQEEVKVYRTQASTRLAVLEEATEGRTASHEREILHLQRLLRERQEAEERLLQSKREVEEELEMVWQAATRENQQMRGSLLDSTDPANMHGWAISSGVSPGWAFQDLDNVSTPTQHHPHNSKTEAMSKSESDHQNSSADDKQKHGLDFYC